MSKVPLGNICRLQAGSAFPQREQGKLKGEFPFAKVSDLSSATGSSWPGIANWVSMEQRERLKVKVVTPGATVFAKIGEGLRNERFAMAEVPMLIDNNMMAAIPLSGAVQARWLFYKFKTLRISQYVVGSALPYLKQSDLNEIVVEVPSISIQTAIAEILGALDDKISANLHANTLMNQLARASARQATTGANQMELNDIATSVSRGSQPKYADEGHLVLNQKCVRGGRVEIAVARTAHVLPKSTERILRNGDILVNSTGQGTLGRVARWTRNLDDVFVDSHITVVRVDNAVSDQDFVGTLLLDREPDIEALAEGTTGQTELRQSSLRSLPIRLPSLETQKRVGERIRVLTSAMDANDRLSETLAATRDELLPLLMSGRITVRDAERRVEQEV